MTLIDNVILRIPQSSDSTVEAAVRQRWNSLTKPQGSLGMLEDAVIRLAAIQRRPDPTATPQAVYVFCGDHGVCQEGVSAYPQVVTREMIKNFTRGGAAINVLCASLDVDTHIVDAGVNGPKLEGVEDHRVGNGTRNFAREAAMSPGETQTALMAGIGLAERAAKSYNLVGLGEMGIGNTTSASALLCAITGLSAEEATGRGAGLDDAGLLRKRRVIEEALTRYDIPPQQPMRILEAFGGFEIAMMSGFLLGAGAEGLPIMIDGFISSAAFLVARALAPQLDRCVFFAHQSAERGHRHLLAWVGARPLLSLEMRLGEGTGAALAMHLLRSAVALFNDMSTFEEAAVSGLL